MLQSIEKLRNKKPQMIEIKILIIMMKNFPIFSSLRKSLNRRIFIFIKLENHSINRSATNNNIHQHRNWKTQILGSCEIVCCDHQRPLMILDYLWQRKVKSVWLHIMKYFCCLLQCFSTNFSTLNTKPAINQWKP